MHIAILTWGISTEREVALRSGANMKDWVQKSGHTCESYDIPSEMDDFLAWYKTYDLVIPVLHGRYGEDGIVTGLCEALGLRVAGSPSWVHALCIDKYRTNCVVEKIGIKIPKTWVPGLPPVVKLLPTEDQDTLEIALIVKPNQGWSSLATAKATTLEEFKYAIQSVHDVITSLTEERVRLLSQATWPSDFVRNFPSLEDIPMVQECIDGQEFTVWVYRDSSSTHVLPIIEIRTLSWEFFDYQEKYESDGSNEIFWEIPAPLEKNLIEQSTKIFDHLGCRGCVRLDWRYDGKDIYFLEVNTIPWFTSWSLVPKMWKKAGKTEKEFIEMLAL